MCAHDNKQNDEEDYLTAEQASELMVEKFAAANSDDDEKVKFLIKKILKKVAEHEPQSENNEILEIQQVSLDIMLGDFTPNVRPKLKTLGYEFTYTSDRKETATVSVTWKIKKIVTRGSGFLMT